MVFCRTSRWLPPVALLFAGASVACGNAQPRTSPSTTADGQAAPADVFRVACHLPTGVDDAPKSLLDTGCFAASGNAATALYGYTVNGVLWADSADKQRWFALPRGTPATFDGNGVLVLPPGGGVFKSLLRASRRLETRLIFRDANAVYQTLTYAWNDAVDDATLVPADGQVRTFSDGSSWE